MSSHFRHCIAYGKVDVKELTVSSGIPFGESREFLRDCMEEADDHSNGGSFHIVTELVDGNRIL
jgi:hypothetical protein